MGICDGVPLTAALVFISFYYVKVVNKIKTNKIKKLKVSFFNLFSYEKICASYVQRQFKCIGQLK